MSANVWMLIMRYVQVFSAKLIRELSVMCDAWLPNKGFVI